ncbi:hypothetical protein AGMMS49982_02470 [Bacteroidia bacterium]|nr:hypothetical protein AGMMS49982_02470 [Bacteroidia bacterium]
MTQQKTSTDAVAQVEKSVGEIISKTDEFLDKHLKTIEIVILAVVVIVVGYFAYRHFILLPREKEAQEVMFPAQSSFEYQQWAVALNGDGSHVGFLEIIDEYGGTASGNLAKAYAGLCQAHLGDYEAALDNLKSYSPGDRLFAAQVIAAIGDCYVSSGDSQTGVSYFEKAAKKADNKALSPLFLNKAAEVYTSLDETEKALKIYTKIQTEYPEFAAANAIEKYIERLK